MWDSNVEDAPSVMWGLMGLPGKVKPQERIANLASCYQPALPAAQPGSSRSSEEQQPASVWSALHTNERNAASFRCLPPPTRSPAHGFLFSCTAVNPFDPASGLCTCKLSDQPTSASLPVNPTLGALCLLGHSHPFTEPTLADCSHMTHYQTTSQRKISSNHFRPSGSTTDLAKWLLAIGTAGCIRNPQHTKFRHEKNKAPMEKRVPCAMPWRLHGKGNSPNIYNSVPNIHSYSSLSHFFTRGRSSLWGTPLKRSVWTH